MTWRGYAEWRGFSGTECATGCEVFAVYGPTADLIVSEFYGDGVLKAANGGTMVNYASCTTAIT